MINLKQISKVYNQGKSNEVVVTEGFDLEIKAGESVAVVGRSGAGKSSILHIAGLLDKPNSGEIIINDNNVIKFSEGKKAKIRNEMMGFVYQYHHLLHEFSALENVMMPLLIQGVSKAKAKAKAEELLEIVGLKERGSHRPNELSGGERQRVAIARALVNDPKIIMADEPTGNLDAGTSDGVTNYLFDLANEKNISMLIVTHSKQLANRCDRKVEL